MHSLDSAVASCLSAYLFHNELEPGLQIMQALLQVLCICTSSSTGPVAPMSGLAPHLSNDPILGLRLPTISSLMHVPHVLPSNGRSVRLSCRSVGHSLLYQSLSDVSILVLTSGVKQQGCTRQPSLDQFTVSAECM